MNDQILIEKIRQIYNKKHPAPGLCVIIEINNKKIFQFSHGNFTDRHSNKIGPDTIFDLASISKIYTTALIIELIHDNQIDINAPCSYYLPIFNRSRLKVINLLTQRSNFGVRLSEYRKKYKNNFSKVVFAIKPPVEPSNSVMYENITFLYIGKIIETIKQCRLDLLLNDFFKRHGLTQTYLGLKKQTEFTSAPTEVFDEKIIKNETHDESACLLGGVAGNAGVFSSANDLTKFGNIWLNDSLITNRKLKEIVYKNYDTQGTTPQALGWWMRLPFNIKLPDGFYSHTGFTGSLLAINPQKKIVISIVCNRTYYGRNNNSHKYLWKEVFNFIEG